MVPVDRVRRIAVTGGIATGKSHVREELARLGVPTIDSDLLARDAVAPGTPGLEAIVARFGPGVLDPSGALNRRALADIVFVDPDARLALEAIVHPAVRAATEAWFAALDPSSHPFAVADVPLLYEVGRDRDFDAVIVAAADPETQVRRVVARDGVSEADARLRLAAQMPIEEKVKRADFVVNTEGPVEETRRQVLGVVTRLKAQRDAGES
jgi:dephospho-CoA kinase